MTLEFVQLLILLIWKWPWYTRLILLQAKVQTPACGNTCKLYPLFLCFYSGGSQVDPVFPDTNTWLLEVTLMHTDCTPIVLLTSHQFQCWCLLVQLISTAGNDRNDILQTRNCSHDNTPSTSEIIPITSTLHFYNSIQPLHSTMPSLIQVPWDIS